MEESKIRREFDLSLKLDLVRQIEKGALTVSGVSTTYRVSRSAVYKWLKKYSQLYRSNTRVIVEKRSMSKKKESEYAVFAYQVGRHSVRVPDQTRTRPRALEQKMCSAHFLSTGEMARWRVVIPLWHRIVAGPAPGMATPNPFYRQPTPFEKAMFFKGFQGIV